LHIIIQHWSELRYATVNANNTISPFGKNRDKCTLIATNHDHVINNIGKKIEP
jgi:bifunctional N-acetylglucosamine-1-phosphate-uridyltransferase/glucosamine-1-phosphate-acetyltransferase GlmU-like protein